MTIDVCQVQKIADLAKLNLEETAELFASQLEKTLKLIGKMDSVDTSHVPPVPYSSKNPLPFREDIVTEKNQRESFQEIAPMVAAGLYLVPKVIE